MPKFHQFNGYRLDVRTRDHNPPHFHVIGPDFHALVRIDNLDVMRGSLPGRIRAEVNGWAAEHRADLVAEWRRLNERD